MAAIKAYANCDHAYVVWRLDAPVPDCRGFALYRRTGAGEQAEQALHTWVGFAGETAPSGASKPSTEWPIQKFMWSDYDVPARKPVSYRAVPMIGAKGALQPDETHATGWSEPVSADADAGDGMSAYFNRGIVATQWLARRLRQLGASGSATGELTEAIAKPGNAIRNFLGGAIIDELPALLDEAQRKQTQVYAALYELKDPQLIEKLTALGGRASVILANGPGLPDDNRAARTTLRESGVNVFDRLVSSSHFAHNKFLVLCDSAGKPQKVWTGSTNWTETGLCTQANNALLIEDATVAGWYQAEWEALRAAGSEYPPALFEADDRQRSTSIGECPTDVWFAPVHELIDLEDARRRIVAASEGILFLMFNPGPRGTLLNDIIERTTAASSTYDPSLYVHGVLNQDPSTAQNPIVGLFHRGEFSEANVDVVLPAAVNGDFGFWIKELLKLPRTHAMVHSKTIVIDPFGDKPVVMTGSHNLGPKASAQNDDNLVIVEGSHRLAAAYAVNIMGVYNQYRWRFHQMQAAEGSQPSVATAAGAQEHSWAGLQDDDRWQNEYFSGAKLRELQFWLGQDVATATQPAPAEAATRA